MDAAAQEQREINRLHSSPAYLAMKEQERAREAKERAAMVQQIYLQSLMKGMG
jgi:hypothetical protein